MPPLETSPLERPRSYARWALSHGISRAVLSSASWRGDPLAELMWSRVHCPSGQLDGGDGHRRRR
ncbi:hypothetical protein [Nocardioides panzhihuensis]|uniref:Uncharacterized protein n=1 Tax=Nocardioides panzhihuensis TaxID=860243 RepID=A0A7Z0DRJ3_9ACTN|nr:hypothetical protein [Nocardioides panzhihuensis]NYI80348.1 hypothetical protein [Nocardioides panzhihuensis]